MIFYREVECECCEEGRIFRGYRTYLNRRMELVDDEEYSDCGECEGTGIITIEEEE